MRSPVDLGMTAQGVVYLEPVHERADDVIACLEPAEQVQIRLLLERAQEHAVSLAPPVVAEVLETGCRARRVEERARVERDQRRRRTELPSERVELG